jgi:putative flippase GtrA
VGLDQQSAGTVVREYLSMLVVGVISTAIDFAVFNLFLWAGVAAGWANLAALTVATLVAYWGNLRWSFGHRQVSSTGRSLVLFVLVNLVTAGLVELGVIVAARYWDEPLQLNIAKAALTVIATLVRFVAYRLWVYRE